MQLPQQFQPHFVHASLIIVADHVNAHFYLAGGDTIEQLDSIAEPRERKQDSEGSFSSSDGTHTVNPDADASDTPRQNHFVKRFTEYADALEKQHGVHNLYLVMPPEILHITKRHFSPTLLGCIRKELPEMLVDSHITNVLNKLFS